MKAFEEFLKAIDHDKHRVKIEEVLKWVAQTFPELTEEIKWNQPMFMDHGTFIIGFSVSKHHLAASPERKGIIQFSDEIKKAGYEHSKMLIRFPWDQPMDYVLLKKIIEYNIKDKVDCSTFWRK